MSWGYIGAAAVATVGGALFGQKGGGGGGNVSADTQGGSQTIDFNPVGLETLQISPFEYMKVQEEFDQEQAQNMQYGGPLYLDMGGGIGDLFETDLFETPIFEPDTLGSEVVVVGGETNTQASAPESTTPYLSSEEVASNLKTQNRQDMFKQIGKDFAKNELPDLLAKSAKQQNTSPNVRGRGNIVPGSKGGMAYRRERQETAPQGITPFQYREMQGGGALNRQMFAQNYMPNGGDIRGPGGPKDDLIPVMASNGEYMLSKAAVDQAGGGNHARGIANLEQFNNRGNRRYG